MAQSDVYKGMQDSARKAGQEIVDNLTLKDQRAKAWTYLKGLYSKVSPEKTVIAAQKTVSAPASAKSAPAKKKTTVKRKVVSKR